jgi:hypothetical protein
LTSRNLFSLNFWVNRLASVAETLWIGRKTKDPRQIFWQKLTALWLKPAD